MANHTTGAQRRNTRMDKIWEKAQEEKRKAEQEILASAAWGNNAYDGD